MNWFFLFVCLILIFFFLGEKRRVNKSFAELKSRLQQVEELLVEVCAVLENERAEDDPSRKGEDQSGKVGKRFSGEEVSFKSKWREEEVKKEDRKSRKTKKIINLYNQGHSVNEIARQTGTGQGEVQLIIDLYSRN